MPSTDNHNEKINAYYDSPAVLFFEQVTQQQIHLGYWDDSDLDGDLATATEQLTQVVIDQIDISADARLLDIGCGCGKPAIEIVKQKACYVEGITINQQQKEKADSLAKTSGVAEKAAFCVGDASRLPYGDRQFDSTMLLESIHHIGHQEALLEAWRVLEPGGTILIADGVVLQDEVADENTKLLADTFVAKSLLKEGEVFELLGRVGFDAIEIIDLTKATQPTWMKLFDATTDNKKEIIEKNGTEFYNGMLEFWLQMATVWSQNAKYLLIKARKA